MNSKLILCLALILNAGLFDSLADGTNANNEFHLDVELSLVEKVASEAALPGVGWTNGVRWNVLSEALGGLDIHHSLWAGDSSIPPQLSKAVLAVFPSLRNPSVIDPFLKGDMWCHVIRMLVKTHDPAMVSILRPYLKQKDLAEDCGTVGYGITTMRICDEAALAIGSLLNIKSKLPGLGADTPKFLIGHEIFTNGSQVTIWKSLSGTNFTAWTGSDPECQERDKNIAELEKTLDAQAENKENPAAAK